MYLTASGDVWDRRPGVLTMPALPKLSGAQDAAHRVTHGTRRGDPKTRARAKGRKGRNSRGEARLADSSPERSRKVWAPTQTEVRGGCPRAGRACTPRGKENRKAAGSSEAKEGEYAWDAGRGESRRGREAAQGRARGSRHRCRPGGHRGQTHEALASTQSAHAPYVCVHSRNH